MYFIYHMMIFVNYVEGIKEENSGLKNIPSSQLLQPHLNPYQPCSQSLSGPTYDHLDTLSYIATLPSSLYPPQYFQQRPIYPVGSTTQASQLHL